jgi:hypothetical protein
MIMDHGVVLTETGKTERVSPMRETMDGLFQQVEREIAAGTFTPQRRGLLLTAIGGLLDYELLAHSAVGRNPPPAPKEETK